MSEDKEVQVVICGGDLCKDGKPHDDNGWEETTDEYGCVTGTAVCSRCGSRAIDRALWRSP